MANISNETATSYNSLPLTSVNSATPIVTLALSRDQQLHYKAYNDFSDLDGDSVPETTYKGSVNYYGYFDPQKCYVYDTSNARFSPNSIASQSADTSGLPNAATGQVPHCNQGGTTNEWSGNFLNWAAMTRMDAIRKLLFGGYRSVDHPYTTDSLTVLERDYLPGDAHAFAKYYSGGDIGFLAPSSFSVATKAPTASYTFSSGVSYNAAAASGSQVTGSTSIVAAGTGNQANNYLLNMGTNVPALGVGPQFGDQISITSTTSSSVLINGVVVAINGKFANGNSTGGDANFKNCASTGICLEIFNGSLTGSGTLTSTTLTDYSQAGISFCNITPDDGSGVSQSDQAAPLIRVAKGNFSLWSANEGRQCRWVAEIANTQSSYVSGVGSNGNRSALSGIGAASENPSQPLQGLSVPGLASTGEYVARVVACDSRFNGQGTERCEQYSKGNYKPIGLLQIYGETGSINFGLVTGSYGRNISGGVLRKNPRSLQDEINVGTDGTFISTSGGIIGNIDHLRIYGYNWGTPGYNVSDGCGFRLAGLEHTGGSNTVGQLQSEGNCSNWGDPLSEIYLESLRFLSGQTATSAFNPSQGNISPSPDSTLGLTVETAQDPLNSTNYCSDLNVIAFNASVSSYDNDQMSGISDIGSSQSANYWTDQIGSQEAISGKQWFIGNSDGSGDSQCTAKTISSFGSVTGLCPEAPNLLGTYLIAGTSYYAHTNRTRSIAAQTSLGVPANDTTSLKVATYGVQLATNTPKIVIPVPNSSRTITILPAFRTSLNGDQSGVTAYPSGTEIFAPGAIVDFKIVQQNIAAGTGTFYVNWENSTQGSDYDQDLWGLISYQVNSTAGTVQVTTKAVSFSAGSNMGFGYIINGTTADGLHIHSGAKGSNQQTGVGFSYNEPASAAVTVTPTQDSSGNTIINSTGGCNNCSVNDPPTTATYTLGSSIAQSLQDPLFYAAKYGGFTDSNSNGRPDLQAEWDANGDGLPDNYFFVANPGALEQALGAVFQQILAKSASGSAAAVVANSRQGQGAVYQALYAPKTSPDKQNRSVNWTGSLQALFVDSAGYLREDLNGNAMLDDYTTDPAVVIQYNPTDRASELYVYNGNPANSGTTLSATGAPLSSLVPIWSANKILSELTDPQNQRSYNTAITNGGNGTYSGGRYIFTFRDHSLGATPDNGTPDVGKDVVAFTPANFGSGEYSILNVTAHTDSNNVSDATKLVNYVRGNDYSGLRSRTTDYYNTGSNVVLRLGDIVNSSPVTVAAPSEAFDQLYSDQTYATFFQKYQNRRNVVYVGADDGMVHAFNAGFYNASLQSFSTTGGNGETAHPLGAELWAYVPFNLLPHLTWLTDPAYGHVWYMDGSPRVFDARIFASDTDHPGGWGTVLVVGMRLGGGPLTLPINPLTSPGFTQYTLGTNTSLITRSAFVVMDITNPESTPKLIAELTNPGGKLGFTTGYPTAAAFKPSDGSTPEKWYLIFGSGPNNSSSVSSALSNATSTQDAQLFVYDLAAESYVTNYGPYDVTTAPNSFVGNPVAVDWDLNYKADVLYFGTSGSTNASPTGSLYRLDFHKSTPTLNGDQLGNESSAYSDWIAPTALISPGPTLATPSVSEDYAGRKWVLSGTGRFLASPDKSSSAQQYLFGVIDNLPNPPSTPGAPAFGNFVDTTNAQVTTTLAVSGVTANGVSVATETQLEAAVVKNDGWKIDLNTISGASSERSISNTSLLEQILFASAYTPATTLCAGDGTSRLFGLYFITGAGYPVTPPFGSTAGTVNGNVGQIVTTVLPQTLNGLATSPTIHVDNNGPNGSSELTINLQTSDGSIFQTLADIANTVHSGEIDWREVHPNTGP